jgi:large subunit ribosomal protein L20
MVRIKRGVTASKRRKKYLKLAKGYVGSNSRLSTLATEQVIQGLNSAYIGRKLRKRNFRRLWICRINALVRNYQTNYSQFIGNLKKKNVFIDRKLLSYLSLFDSPVIGLLYRVLSIKN